MCSPAMTTPNECTCVRVFLPSVLGASLHMWVLFMYPEFFVFYGANLVTTPTKDRHNMAPVQPILEEGSNYMTSTL